MKVKKNNYYIFTLIAFLILSLVMLYYSNFFSKLSNVVNFIGNRSSTINMNLDREFLSYINKEQNYINVEKYYLKLNLFPEEQKIKANIVILGKTDSSINNLVFNLEDGYSIKKLILNKKNISYEYNNNKLLIPNKNLENGKFILEIEYSGIPKSKGFGSFNFDKYKGKNFIYSLNEPIFASTWFPCNDKPDDKALFEVEITNDTNFVSVSNGILVDTKVTGNKKTYIYKTINPISTYLFSVYSGEYHYFEDYVIDKSNDTIRLVYYLFEQETIGDFLDYQPHKQGIKVFSELFGDYAFKDEKYGIAEITWKYGAIEHQTISGFSSDLIQNSISQQDIYIHELAHHWWGNAVGLKDWRDIWLNEGFATYSEALFYEYTEGKNAYIRKIQSFSGDFSESTLYNPTTSLFSKLQYFKGAWVLHMLRNELGDENFFSILKKYYETYKYKNASTQDFINICENISNKDLGYFFDQWVFNGKGKLKLGYNFVKDNSGIKINLRLNNNPIIYKFPLIIEGEDIEGKKLRESYYINGRDTVISFKSAKSLKNITLDPDNKLLKESVIKY